MKKLHLVSIAPLALLACGEVPQEAEVPAGPPVEVTSRELAQAFAANEVAAQQQYGGSTLLVNGEILSIELDMMDEPTITLPGTDEFTSVYVNFEGDATAVTAALSKGQEVTVSCKAVSEVIGSPMLNDCTIQGD